MRVTNIDFKNILLEQKSYKNLLIHSISCKTFVGEKQSRIWLHKTDGFIITDDEIGINHNFEWIRID